MPRPPRLAVSGVPLHVVQRGVNRAPCFLSRDDYRSYLDCLRDAAAKVGCRVHAYVLMTNHVHLLVTPDQDLAASQLMQRVGRRYVRAFNERHRRTGTLWEGRFRSSIVDSERYLLVCQRYIEQNPIRAGMVRAAGDYPWSSHRYYAEGVPDPVVHPHPVFLGMGVTPQERRDAYRQFCARATEAEVLDCIRSAIAHQRRLGARPATSGTTSNHASLCPGGV